MGEAIIKPTHVIQKPDGGRDKNTTVRSYLMEIPSKRLVEGLRLYSCLIDDIYGLDWKHSGGIDLPAAKQPAVRANLAKARASVVRVAMELLQYMETQVKLQDPEGKGIPGHVLPAEVVEENDMTPEEIRGLLAKNKEKLESLNVVEGQLESKGE